MNPLGTMVMDPIRPSKRGYLHSIIHIVNNQSWDYLWIWSEQNLLWRPKFGSDVASIAKWTNQTELGSPSSIWPCVPPEKRHRVFNYTGYDKTQQLGALAKPSSSYVFSMVENDPRLWNWSYHPTAKLQSSLMWIGLWVGSWISCVGFLDPDKNQFNQTLWMTEKIH